MAIEPANLGCWMSIHLLLCAKASSTEPCQTVNHTYSLCVKAANESLG